MTIQLGDTAPDFTADTTEGTMSLHEYLGDGWGILFSHPADYTPVCTTELGAFANRKDEFTRRNTKLIGVSVDDVASHKGWSADIAETQGTALNYPLVGDQDRHGNRPHGLRDRAGQDGAPHLDLSGIDRSQHRRDHPRARRAPTQLGVPRLDPGGLERR